MSLSPVSADSGSVNIEIRPPLRRRQSVEDIGLADANLLDVLTLFEPFGVWRLDIDKGLTYWTRDMFLLHDMEPEDGPVDMIHVIRSYHPDDREHIIGCIEDAVLHRSGFRFVLRIGTKDKVARVVEAMGRFRVNAEGRPELFGTCRALRQRVRSVSINP